MREIPAWLNKIEILEPNGNKIAMIIESIEKAGMSPCQTCGKVTMIYFVDGQRKGHKYFTLFCGACNGEGKE